MTNRRSGGGSATRLLVCVCADVRKDMVVDDNGEDQMEGLCQYSMGGKGRTSRLGLRDRGVEEHGNRHQSQGQQECLQKVGSQYRGR
jgi:hypothetical protein